MQRGHLKFDFETKVDDKGGLSISSPQVKGLKAYFCVAPTDQVILDVITHCIPLYLIQYGLESKRHVMFLEKPDSTLSKGGSFTCIIELTP